MTSGAGGRCLGIDTDALFNLLVLDLLDETVTCLQVERGACFRLAAAPHQLRRAGWVEKRCPGLNRERIARIADELPALPLSSDSTLQEKLSRVTGVDPGEALLLAAACELPDLLLLSGDGRMLRALARSEPGPVQQILERLAGRIVLFPQLILALAERVSLSELERRWRAARLDHKGLKIAFGSTPPTREDDFRQGCEMALRNVTDFCGKDLLFPL
jgi:hypothetical protein